MNYGRMTAATACVVACLAGGSGLAQQAPTASTSSAAQPSPGADEEFLLGLRRMGVIAGHNVACTPKDQREPVIQSVNDLATDLAAQFGLNAAFHFMGAVGYGSGHPFDKAICSRAEQAWKAIEQRYMRQ